MIKAPAITNRCLRCLGHVRGYIIIMRLISNVSTNVFQGGSNQKSLTSTNIIPHFFNLLIKTSTHWSETSRCLIGAY